MRSKNTFKSIQILSVFVVFPLLVFAQDIRDSQDHPLISRYAGQTIMRFDVKEFDPYNLVLSVDKSGAPEKVKNLEGKVTRILYRNPPGRSTTEIFRNFEDGLRRGGAQILFTCAGRLILVRLPKFSKLRKSCTFRRCSSSPQTSPSPGFKPTTNKFFLADFL